MKRNGKEIIERFSDRKSERGDEGMDGSKNF